MLRVKKGSWAEGLGFFVWFILTQRLLNDNDLSVMSHVWQTNGEMSDATCDRR